MGRKTYQEGTKAAVMMALLAGQSVSEVAREYKIPKGTVSGWKRKSQGVANLTTQKKEKIGELLLDYLTTNLETLKEQSKVFRDADWLKKQDAADVAILHGVITDKTIRLLEALSGGDQTE